MALIWRVVDSISMCFVPFTVSQFSGQSEPSWKVPLNRKHFQHFAVIPFPGNCFKNGLLHEVSNKWGRLEKKANFSSISDSHEFANISILNFMHIVLLGFHWNIFKGVFQFVCLQNAFRCYVALPNISYALLIREGKAPNFRFRLARLSGSFSEKLRSFSGVALG